MPKKTYLTLTFNSEGANASEITEALLNLGFTPTIGGYDFVYEWKRSPSVQQLINFAEVVQNTLRGKNILFQMVTPE